MNNRTHENIAHVISDLHITDDKNWFFKQKTGHTIFEHLTPTLVPEVLILAGDLAPIEYLQNEKDKDSVFWNELVEWLNQYRKVIYVAGNHEYYTRNPFDRNISMSVIDEAANNILPDHVEYVGCKNRSIVIGRYVFICSTLWAEGAQDESGVTAIRTSLNDFVAIPHFSYERMIAKFSANVEWIQDELNHFNEQSVYNDLESFPICAAVVTHHAPSLQSVHERYKHSKTNGAFCSDLEYIFQKNPYIDYWVHGHTHDAADYRINKTQVICNPLGYTNWNGTFENREFDPLKTILI